MRNDRRRAAALVATTALTLVACGGNGAPAPTSAGPANASEAGPTSETRAASAAVPGATPSTAAPDATRADAVPSTTSSGTSPLPAIDVVDVATNEVVRLADLLPADKPTLLWMWAPH
jgi:hypothetical protein